VKWTYETSRGLRQALPEKLEHIQIATIARSFSTSRSRSSSSWTSTTVGHRHRVDRSQHYYEKSAGTGSRRARRRGPYKLVSQEAGVQMVFEAWEATGAAPRDQDIVVKGIRTWRPGWPACRRASSTWPME